MTEENYCRFKREALFPEHILVSKCFAGQFGAELKQQGGKKQQGTGADEYLIH